MKMNRRDFFKGIMVGAAVLPVAGTLLGSLRAEAADDMVKEDDANAKALNYCADVKKGAAKCPNRKEAARKDQYCEGCQLYDKAFVGKPAGPCMVLGNKKVAAKGWCNSWVKRA